MSKFGRSWTFGGGLVCIIDEKEYVVMSIREWFKRLVREWKNPELKCTRVGHHIFERVGVIRKDGRCSVCDDFNAVIHECCRCGHIEVKCGEEIRSYSSVSMPIRMWDEMRKKGWVEV